MAIKTKSELQTQSDNTFLDNNTGQIIPVNHRAYNDDVLDTAFVIAGRAVTLNEYNDLRTAGDLIAGCRYSITGVTTPTLPNITPIYVTADSTTTVEKVAFVYGGGGTRIELIIQSDDLSDVLIADAKVAGGAYGNIDGFKAKIANNEVVPVSNGTIANTAIDRYPRVIGRSAFTSNEQGVLITNNLEAQRGQLAQPQYGPANIDKGFLAQVSTNHYFYPDHGVQWAGASVWGRAGAINGSEGVLDFFLDGSNVGAVANIKGNFLKVNDTIMGQVQADFNLTFGSGIVKCSFSLPHWENGGGHTPTIIGHGTLFSLNHQVNIDVRESFTFIDRADLIFNLVGNHNGVISARGCFTFSLNLFPY